MKHAAALSTLPVRLCRHSCCCCSLLCTQQKGAMLVLQHMVCCNMHTFAWMVASVPGVHWVQVCRAALRLIAVAAARRLAGLLHLCSSPAVSKHARGMLAEFSFFWQQVMGSRASLFGCGCNNAFCSSSSTAAQDLLLRVCDAVAGCTAPAASYKCCLCVTVRLLRCMHCCRSCASPGLGDAACCVLKRALLGLPVPWRDCNTN